MDYDYVLYIYIIVGDDAESLTGVISMYTDW